MTAKRALIVLTSHADLGNTGKTTGYYLVEVAAPYYALQEVGLAVDFASPRGGPAPADPGGLAWGDEPGSISARFRGDAVAQEAIGATLALRDVRAEDYAVIWIAGGHGVMWDLPNDPELARIVADADRRGAVVTALCHGVAGLHAAKRPGGASVLPGRRGAGFLNVEEAEIQMTEVMPFLVEDRMRELGGVFSAGAPWKSHVVRDGNLVTGQNAQSAEALAATIANLVRA